jgi:putative membrane protein insertion efficiency factor
MLAKCAIFLIRIYQNTVGLVLPRVCRYEPSCSSYAIQAISRFGILKGGTLGIVRVLKCNPLFPGGFDPVPERRKGTRQ